MLSSSAKLLKVEQVAERTGMSVSFFNKKRLTGGGPKFHKLGRSVRYGEDAIEIWLEDTLRSSTNQT